MYLVKSTLIVNMKFKSSFFSHFPTLVLGLISIPLAAQEKIPFDNDGLIKVKKRTILEMYEPGLVLPAEERLQLKKDHLAQLKERKEIIDTMNISTRKRKQLLKELYRSPFDDKWNKVITTIQTEEEENEDY